MSEFSLAGIAKTIMIIGGVLLVGGAVLLLLAKLNIPLGRLPGDIRVEGERGSFYFPLVTSFVLSLLLTIILNLIGKFLK